MRFGIIHFSHGSTEEVVNLVQLAERNNFDSYWISEVGLARDLYVVLAQMALHTKRLNVGAEANTYTRHPAITANAMATIDEVSGGRIALMMGTGHRGYLHQVGIQPHSNATEIMRETIQICRGVWSGKSFNYDGARFAIRNLRIGYEFSKNIPIIVADNDPKMLELSGESAEGIMTNFTPLEHMPNVWGHVKAGLAKSGRKTSDFRFYMQPLIAIAKNRGEARKAVERIIFHSLSLVHSHDSLRESIGLEKEDLTTALEASVREMARVEGDIGSGTLRAVSAIMKLLKREVVDKLLDKTTIYGTAEDVIEGLKKYEKEEVWEVPIGPVPYPNPYETDVSEYIKIIGEEVIPHFKGT